MKILILATATALVLIVAAIAYGAVLNGPIGTQPDVTPQLRIVEPSLPFASGEPIPVRVAYQDFDMRPDLRCGPAGPCTGTLPQTVTEGRDQGHVHVYFQRIDNPGHDDSQDLPNVDSDSFCIPATVEADGYSGVVSGVCPALPRGFYRVTAEFQSNSHVSALKATNRPQDVPTSDAVLVVAR